MLLKLNVINIFFILLIILFNILKKLITNINDEKYYNKIDLLIDEKEIIKYKKIDIKRIKGKIEKIKENINL